MKQLDLAKIVGALVMIIVSAGLWLVYIHFYNGEDGESQDLQNQKHYSGCFWEEKIFKQAGITTVVEICVKGKAYDSETGHTIVFKDEKNRLSGSYVTNNEFEFYIQVLNKDTDKTPMEIIKGWYDELTPEQKEVCEIQSPETPLTYFPSGEPISPNSPHPTPGKRRYKIDIKQKIVDAILEEHDGYPGSSLEYDYLCGTELGSAWGETAPYFEFDERSPEVYLFVSSYGLEVPPIDLNSIKF